MFHEFSQDLLRQYSLPATEFLLRWSRHASGMIFRQCYHYRIASSLSKYLEYAAFKCRGPAVTFPAQFSPSGLIYHAMQTTGQMSIASRYRRNYSSIEDVIAAYATQCSNLPAASAAISVTSLKITADTPRTADTRHIPNTSDSTRNGIWRPARPHQPSSAFTEPSYR